MLRFFKQSLLVISHWSARFGMLLLIGAMLATTLDVLARKLFGFTYPGTIDVVQLLVLGAAFLAIPYAFITRSHVAVAIVTERFSDRWKHAVGLLAGILSFGLMLSFAWFGYQQAMMQLEYGDVSQTVGIPMIWYWVPLLYGCLLSVLVSLQIAIESLHGAIRGDNFIH
ncbi:MAG: TRAP transporter small permease [Chromatiales bacterium]|nr:TRAP transporter small permease [Chromatiales bacterium]